MSGALQAVFQNQRSFGYGPPPAPSQLEYTTSGSYSWVVPSGLVSACVLTVGGGGASGSSGSNVSGGGGGGGGLAYVNALSVTPGETLTLVVGAGGVETGGAGGLSEVKRGATVLTQATGGTGGASAVGGGNVIYAPGGTATVGTGGSGGAGGQPLSNTGGGGGGGAAGYSGNGGNGGSGNSDNYPGTAGAGGGGGGGPGYTQGSAGGGGVGILGEGASGAYLGRGADGQGGSGGSNGVRATTAGQITGGSYGGGAGAEEDDTSIAGTRGGVGAVRILWGDGRAFPSTNTGNV